MFRGIIQVQCPRRLGKEILYPVKFADKSGGRKMTCSFSSTTDTMALCIPSLQAINCISAVNVLFGLETAEVDTPDTGIPGVSLVLAKSLGGRL